jgi:hypothetical protein
MLRAAALELATRFGIARQSKPFCPRFIRYLDLLEEAGSTLDFASPNRRLDR